MMRIPFALGCVAALAACSPSASAAGDVTRRFPASGFDAVRLAGSDTVRVIHGSSAAVIARGPPESVDRLDIRTQGNVLVVSRKPTGLFGWSRGTATVTVIMPIIRAIDLAGSGHLSVDRVDGPQFDASLTGSGDLSLMAVDAQSLKLRLTGSGNATAAGRTRVAALSVTGSGTLTAEKLIAETVSLSVIGSGSASAHATKSATLSTAGSGNATVYGTRDCSISKSGSGDARCTG